MKQALMHPWRAYTGRVEKLMATHPKLAEFFDWYGEEVDPNNDPVYAPGFWADDKKTPAAATAGASEPNQKIIYLSLARQQPERKVVR